MTNVLWSLTFVLQEPRRCALLSQRELPSVRPRGYEPRARPRRIVDYTQPDDTWCVGCRKSTNRLCPLTTTPASLPWTRHNRSLPDLKHSQPGGCGSPLSHHQRGRVVSGRQLRLWIFQFMSILAFRICMIGCIPKSSAKTNTVTRLLLNQYTDFVFVCVWSKYYCKGQLHSMLNGPQPAAWQCQLPICAA